MPANELQWFAPPQLNLVHAWAWILAGFLSGAVIGLKFRDEKWLGGYASFPRRMYRLAHISFFGLGIANLAFWLTARDLAAPSTALLTISSLGFVAGALFMPVCCIVTAHFPRLHSLFALPVSCLVGAGSLTLYMVVQT